MSKWLVALCLVLTPTHLFAQGTTAVLQTKLTAPAEELESVITESKRLNDKNAFVRVTARAAALISFTDPSRGEQMFLDLWKFAHSQMDSKSDAQQASVHILKCLQSRNPKLARQLMAERLSQDGSSNAARSVGFDDDAALPGKLAAALLDTDPAAAAAILEQNLTIVVTMEGVAALLKLRERNFLLADYIAAKVIDTTPNRASVASMAGLYILGAYVFAGPEAPSPSSEAASSLESLQARYFTVGLEVLRASLTESNEALVNQQHLTARQLQFRGAYQAELAAILAALAPRLRLALAQELAGIATKLAPQVPANMPRLSRNLLGRLSGNFRSEDPEERFFFALSNGDYDKARNELERINDSEKRKLYEQLLVKSEARTFLARSELMEAVTAIRKLEDPTSRLVMYLDALHATQKKRDADVAKIIINEARLLIPQTNRNGLHLRALLAFASRLMKLGVQDDALDFLNGAIATINSLSTTIKEKNAGDSLAEVAMARLNDPNTLFDEPNMEYAFTEFGQLDLDLGLAHARRIQPKPVQLLARLLTIQSTVKLSALKPKPAPLPAKVSTKQTPTP